MSCFYFLLYNKLMKLLKTCGCTQREVSSFDIKTLQKLIEEAQLIYVKVKKTTRKHMATGDVQPVQTADVPHT